tara:strand:- start:2424 stop:2654 length:231 start_codon:yes stop_codon:yes gene_type:complete
LEEAALSHLSQTIFYLSARLAQLFNSTYNVSWRGVAQSGLARSVRDAEAGGSNPLAPIIINKFVPQRELKTNDLPQ